MGLIELRTALFSFQIGPKEIMYGRGHDEPKWILSAFAKLNPLLSLF